MVQIGYFGSDEPEETVWTPYEGKPVIVQSNGVRISGVVYEVNFKDGYVDFKPSLVPTGDYLRVEKDVPTRFMMSSSLPVAIRPLGEGDLEREVEDHKIHIDLSRKKD